jgi:hypothetical protein
MPDAMSIMRAPRPIGRRRRKLEHPIVMANHSNQESSLRKPRIFLKDLARVNGERSNVRTRRGAWRMKTMNR